MAAQKLPTNMMVVLLTKHLIKNRTKARSDSGKCRKENQCGQKCWKTHKGLFQSKPAGSRNRKKKRIWKNEKRRRQSHILIVDHRVQVDAVESKKTPKAYPNGGPPGTSGRRESKRRRQRHIVIVDRRVEVDVVESKKRRRQRHILLVDRQVEVDVVESKKDPEAWSQ